MKKVSLTIVVFVALSLFLLITIYACKNSKSPTSPTTTPTTTTSIVTYNQSDLTGHWKGTAKSSSNTYNLDLTIDSNGRVSGTARGNIDGIQQTQTFLPEYTRWTLDNTGKITFENQVWMVMISPTQGVIYRASWELQMGSGKLKLTGTLDIDRSTLRNMNVILHKKSS